MQAILTTRPNEGIAAPAMPHGRSAASWGAIFAGAFVAMAASLILLSLGAAIIAAANLKWPPQTIGVRILDREGHEVFAREKAKRA